MEKQVVFLPKTLLDTTDATVELSGFVQPDKNARYHFVLPDRTTAGESEPRTIGHFCRTVCRRCGADPGNGTLCLTRVDGTFGASLSPAGRDDRFVLVVYDPSRLRDYGTLIAGSREFVCFAMLSKWLAAGEAAAADASSSSSSSERPAVEWALVVLGALVGCTETRAARLTVSRITLFKHAAAAVKNCRWFVDSLARRRGPDSAATAAASRKKAINYAASCACDALLGVAVLYALNVAFASSDQLFARVSSVSHDVIKVLQGTLQWLMGSPAGLKLNDPLNSLLGTCFLYLVNLWWSFLVLCRPFLEWTFRVYVFIGIFGLSYQIAILEDVLMIVSFHVYCIYIYAAWLYNLQRKSLLILAKLFVGRSCNPQPGRTVPYSTQQLYVGTISFAILLFLLPTTLIYYIVFVVMRIIIVLVRGILIRLRYMLQVLPLYTTLIWLVKPSSSVGIIKMNIINNANPNTVVLNTTVVADSWWATVKYYLPESVEQPSTVSWLTLAKRVCTGKILYPI